MVFPAAFLFVHRVLVTTKDVHSLQDLILLKTDLLVSCSSVKDDSVVGRATPQRRSSICSL